MRDAEGRGGKLVLHPSDFIFKTIDFDNIRANYEIQTLFYIIVCT